MGGGVGGGSGGVGGRGGRGRGVKDVTGGHRPVTGRIQGTHY